MLRRLGIVCAAALAALPVAALAEGVDFTAPDLYMVAAPAPNARGPGVYRVWDRSIGGARHSIVVSASPAFGDLTQNVDGMVASVSSRNAIDVSRSDAAPLCGAPSVRVSYAYANQLTYVYRYAIVGGRLLIASYAHPLGTDADPNALAALDTLCSGIHQPAGPKGWSIIAPYPANGSAWRPTPDSLSLVSQSVRPAEPGHDRSIDPFQGKGTVTSDRRGPCGAVTVHRATASLDDGRTLEFAAGTVRGFDYLVAYMRPPSTEADPSALATLTSFCEDTAAR